MDKLFAARHFLKYKISGGTLHDVHSPFVYDLYNNVILDTTPYYAFENLESLRSYFLLSTDIIEVTDFGQGGKSGLKKQLELNKIAKSNLLPAKYAQLLFRLVNHFQPESILELGTSLGLTTLYLATPVPGAKVLSFEGCPNLSDLARRNFDKMQMKDIRLITGNFDETLKPNLESLNRLDFVYIDGNHRKEPTLTYFRTCLERHHDKSLFVFDDIHWSQEMHAAWQEIKKDPNVSISIDLYRLGLVFFKTGIPKQHFILRF